MGVKRKELDILRILERSSRTVRELSEETGMSERNLRYSLENLEYYLKKSTEKNIDKRSRRLSVHLTGEEMDGFLCFLRRGNYIYSAEERREYILNTFLFHRTPKLKEMGEVLGVSRTTLKKDMADLEEFLREYSLEFLSEGNRVFIGGNEKKLRHLMMCKMEEHLKGPGLDYPMESTVRDMIEREWQGKEERVLKLLREVEECLSAEFSREFLEVMTYYLWVTLCRVEGGNYILRKHNADFLRKTREYTGVKMILEGYIPEGLEYEYLHLAEYFISGSTTEEYYEERIAIELFTYDLLRRAGETLGEDLLRSEIFLEITGYLTSAIYRMKNNFLLAPKEEYPGRGEIGDILDDICQGETYLSEKLREEEIYNIGGYIEKGIRESSSKVMEMEVILDILRKNSKGMDEEKVRQGLMERYGTYIEDRKKSQGMRELSYYIEKGRVTESCRRKLQEVIEEGNRMHIEDGGIGTSASAEGYVRANIFRNEWVDCYYNTVQARRSAMNFISYRDEYGRGRVLILLILCSSREHLKALSDLKRLVESVDFTGMMNGALDKKKLLKAAENLHI